MNNEQHEAHREKLMKSLERFASENGTDERIAFAAIALDVENRKAGGVMKLSIRQMCEIMEKVFG